MPAMRPQLRMVLTMALMGLALAACRREPSDPASDPGSVAAVPGQPESPARGEVFELTWLGVLPCADCDGIQTRLMLSGDGGARRYVLEETYLGGDGDDRFEQTGDWTEESTRIDGEPAVVYRLDPQGTSRWFWLQPDGGLEMLDGQDRPSSHGIVYRLQRL